MRKIQTLVIRKPIVAEPERSLLLVARHINKSRDNKRLARLRESKQKKKTGNRQINFNHSAKTSESQSVAIFIKFYKNLTEKLCVIYVKQNVEKMLPNLNKLKTKKKKKYSLLIISKSSISSKSNSK